MKQTLAGLKGEIDSSTVTIGDFHTPLSLVDRKIRQKIREEMEDLSNTVNQLDLKQTYIEQSIGQQ